MELTKRDTSTQSRKGRKPKNGVPMSAAERKRQQRQRERDSKSDVPSWLKVRNRLWQLVQREFMFCNADEVSHALSGLGMLLIIMNSYQSVGRDAIHYADFYFNPMRDGQSKPERIDATYPELLPYRWLGQDEFPSAQHTTLVQLIRDLINESQNTEGGAV